MDVFEEPMVVQDIEYFITASAGVSVYPVDGENSETLIKMLILQCIEQNLRKEPMYLLFTND